jgi:hypothetical protein
MQILRQIVSHYVLDLAGQNNCPTPTSMTLLVGLENR